MAEVTDTDTDWRLSAACRGKDPNIFFLEREGKIKAEEAKTICQRCPVRGPCADYAEKNGERYGIWGGLTREDRRGLRREIRTGAAVQRVVKFLDRVPSNL